MGCCKSGGRGYAQELPAGESHHLSPILLFCNRRTKCDTDPINFLRRVIPITILVRLKRHVASNFLLSSASKQQTRSDSLTGPLKLDQLAL